MDTEDQARERDMTYLGHIADRILAHENKIGVGRIAFRTGFVATIEEHVPHVEEIE